MQGSDAKYKSSICNFDAQKRHRSSSLHQAYMNYSSKYLISKANLKNSYNFLRNQVMTKQLCLQLLLLLKQELHPILIILSKRDIEKKLFNVRMRSLSNTLDYIACESGQNLYCSVLQNNKTQMGSEAKFQTSFEKLTRVEIPTHINSQDKIPSDNILLEPNQPKLGNESQVKLDTMPNEPNNCNNNDSQVNNNLNKDLKK